MKLNKLLTLTMISSIMMFTSCENAIEIDPADEIVESNSITTIEEAKSATIGVYGVIPGTQNLAWNSIFTDEVKVGPTNAGAGIQVHTWSINSSTSEPGTLFSSYYTAINRANKVLVAIDNLNISDPVLDGLKGELLTIRAWSHFKILGYFAESFTNNNALAIPYIDYVVVLDKPARNTVGEVLTGINNDLTTAKDLIPTTNTDNVFFSLNAIKALESRIALYTGDYTTAITLSSELITEDRKSVV